MSCINDTVVIDYYYVFLDIICVFFFKQKTAYEMRISDWSSDVCSSDLAHRPRKRDRDARQGLGKAGRAPDPRRPGVPAGTEGRPVPDLFGERLLVRRLCARPAARTGGIEHTRSQDLDEDRAAGLQERERRL